jgi:fibronectin-binding autotransporter adhesin
MSWNTKSTRDARVANLVSTLLCSASLATLVLLNPGQAQAQSTWQGDTSTDYNTGSNWDNSTAPVSSGQSAIFDSTSNSTVLISSAVSPDGWTFTSNAPAYNISGSAVTLGASGIVDNASGQTITISNDLGGTCGVAIHDSTGTMTLSGSNSYTGATTIDVGGTLAAGSSTAFSPNSDFTVNGTLDLAGYGNSIGSLSGSGTVTNSSTTNSATLTVGGNNTSSTFNGTLQDGGANPLALTVTGTGTLTLTGANTYSGGTTIDSNATLQVGNGGTSGSLGSGSVIDNGTLVYNRNVIVTLYNAISGSGGLTLSRGTLELFGSNSYSGPTIVNSGATLWAGSATAFSPTSDFTVNGMLDVSANSNSIGSLSGMVTTPTVTTFLFGS